MGRNLCFSRFFFLPFLWQHRDCGCQNPELLRSVWTVVRANFQRKVAVIVFLFEWSCSVKKGLCSWYVLIKMGFILKMKNLPCLNRMKWSRNAKSWLHTAHFFADEFQRAVYISTGQMLHPYVVHTVFQLFDKDGKLLNIFFSLVHMLPSSCTAFSQAQTINSFRWRSRQ